MITMAKIKNTMTVSLEEFGKKAGEYALDEFEYKGLTIRQWADKITSGEYQPVKHGRWKLRCYGDYPYCSNCNNEPKGREMTLFCPNCGAKMDGDANENKT